MNEKQQYTAHSFLLEMDFRFCYSGARDNPYEKNDKKVSAIYVGHLLFCISLMQHGGEKQGGFKYLLCQPGCKNRGLLVCLCP